MRTREGTAQAIRQSLQQRGAEATRELRQTAHLPTNPRDVNVLGTALAEVAANEARRNPRFADELHSRYEELLASQRTPRSTSKGADLPPLIPLPQAEPRERRLSIDPFAPPDPAFLIRVYGHPQLARALHDYSMDALKEAATRVQQNHPGTKPTSRARRDTLIAYIVEHS
jgi:hypothetical protein